MSVVCRMEKEGQCMGKHFNNSCLEWQWSLFDGDVRHVVRYTSSWNHFTIYVNEKVVAKESKKKGMLQKKKKIFECTFQTDTGAEATLRDEDGVVMLIPSVRDVAPAPMLAPAPSTPSKRSDGGNYVSDLSMERNSAWARETHQQDTDDHESFSMKDAEARSDDLHVQELGERAYFDSGDVDTNRSTSVLGVFEFEVIVLCDGERKTGLVWRCVDDGLECIRVEPNSPLAEWNMMRTGTSSYGQPRDMRQGDLVVAVNEETESTEMIQILNNSRDQDGAMVLMVRRNANALQLPDEKVSHASSFEACDAKSDGATKGDVIVAQSEEAASAEIKNDQESMSQDSGALLQELENEEAQRLSEGGPKTQKVSFYRYEKPTTNSSEES
eukprot:GEMP01060424.1.p1 GENE.GEMP01060424.1~~GEMP01060424.1.p1  ORF type:complete len:384 (+),score=85.50 GEMP01060424.1:54-1205(+)